MSIILIGMPGAGKSTIGSLLARKIGIPFKDTDDIIFENEGRELKNIVKEDGFETFLNIQQRLITKADLNDCVVATGGSVVLSENLMEHLKSIGTIVYLKVDFEALSMRLSADRRLARPEGHTFKQVFQQRDSLYKKYADVIIDCTGRTPIEIVADLSGMKQN